MGTKLFTKGVICIVFYFLVLLNGFGQSNNQKNMKIRAEFYGHSTKIKVMVNDVYIGFEEDGNWSVELFNTDHPMKKKDLPAPLIETLFFILKPGVNTIRIEFENTKEQSNYGFKLMLTSSEYPLPIFMIMDDYRNTPHNQGAIEKEFILYDEVPADFKTVLGYDDLGLVYVVAPGSSLAARLNSESIGSVGGTKATMPFKLSPGVPNRIEVEYSAQKDTELTYTIFSANYKKVVTRKLRKDEIGAEQFDIK